MHSTGSTFYELGALLMVRIKRVKVVVVVMMLTIIVASAEGRFYNRTVPLLTSLPNGMGASSPYFRNSLSINS